MRPEVVIVDEVLEQFVGEVIEIVEGCALDDVVIEGPPEALDLAVGLRPIGPGVAVFDAKLEQHGLEGMLVGLVAGGELGAIVGQDFLEHEPIGDVEGVDHLQRLEHYRQRLLGGQHVGPGQARAAVDQADDIGRGRGWREEHIARQLMQVDVAELPELVLDNATLLLAHRRRAAVQSIARQHPIDGRGRAYRLATLAQDRMNLIAIHAFLAAADDRRLDALWFAPFPPLWPAPARQQICLIAALQIAVVVLAERLRAGSVVAVEIPHTLERRRLADNQLRPIKIPASTITIIWSRMSGIRNFENDFSNPSLVCHGIRFT